MFNKIFVRKKTKSDVFFNELWKEVDSGSEIEKLEDSITHQKEMLKKLANELGYELAERAVLEKKYLYLSGVPFDTIAVKETYWKKISKAGRPKKVKRGRPKKK